MSYLQSLIDRLARVEAATKILQDKIAGGGIQNALDLIDNRFGTYGLDSTQARMDYESAQEATFRRISLEDLGAEDDVINDASFEESDRWERFRGSYEGQ